MVDEIGNTVRSTFPPAHAQYFYHENCNQIPTLSVFFREGEQPDLG
jgi:hypothetical protein